MDYMLLVFGFDLYIQVMCCPGMYQMTSSSGIFRGNYCRPLGLKLLFWFLWNVSGYSGGRIFWTIYQLILFFWYTWYRNRSMVNPDHSEWVPTSLCKKPRCSSLKQITPGLSVFLIIWGLISFLEFSSHTILTGEYFYLSSYNSIIVLISAQIHTRRSCFPIFHWVTVLFQSMFF